MAGPVIGACSSNGNGGATTTDGDGGVPDASAEPDIVVDTERFPQSIASGDPKPNSVVLWTRFDGGGEESIALWLELALDDEFRERVTSLGETRLRLTAERRWGHCVRARIDGLEPDTHYYYRFVYDDGNELLASRTGRTLTAPEPEAERRVKFAVMSCQDYGGRYFHAHRHASEQDIDFIVHLGDYIYETAGDPSFQQEDGEREIRFDDAEGALELTSANDVPGGDADDAEPFLAARSLDNYRQLYRTARSDRDLQRLHERHPMICVWDDHEFSNDAFGQNATYLSGREDEKDPERHSNADQAWFEYMPVDYDAGANFEYDREEEFPDNLRIYRDFRFGRHLHLVMTDLRRYRADHILPEDAVPAAVAVSQERLEELLGEVPEIAQAYVDIDELADGTYADALRDASEQGIDFGVDVTRLMGLCNVGVLNELIDVYNMEADGDPLDPLDPEDESFSRGIAYVQAGKTADYTSFGTRYFVEPEAFELIALDRYDATDGESEEAMGAEQREWFIETLRGSDASWKVWGNSYTLATRAIDLSSLTLPGGLSRRFRLSADDWDGFPNERKALLAALDGVEDIVAVTGDSHSFFASTTGINDPPGVIEFVCGAISSATYQSVLQSGVGGVPGLDLLAPLAGPLLEQANPHIAYQNVADNGFAVVEASEDDLRVRFFELALGKVFEAELEGRLEEHFAMREFRVQRGSGQIEQRLDGEFRRWDAEGGRYV